MKLIISFLFVFNVDVFALNTTRSCDEDPSSNICLLHELKTLKQELKTSQLEVESLKKAVGGLQAQDTNCPTVAFRTQLTHDVASPSAGFHFVFDDIKLNIGNNYNNHHGTFVAPVSGIYFLSYRFTITPGTSKSLIRLVMKINGEIVSHAMSAYESHYITASYTNINHLNAGDDVWLEVLENNYSFAIIGNIANLGPYSVFEGFLITC
ncbi:complement C1q-like protein 4 [Mytilus trossulus]|uniref:complement C1q-like protein 4 n=1 Tax=Mytilus trossulus TaxID=6551 RepID=UPI003004F537